jgi:hypothetical protein
MAKQHNTSVAVQLIMPSSVAGAVDADARPSAILKRTRLSTRGYTAYLSRQSFVHSLIIDRRPRFLLGGERVVAAFRREAERSYVDRFTLNRNWRTRLASFDEVDIWRDYSRPPYQFDWQVFHRGLVTQHYTELHDTLAKDGPTLLTQVALSEDIATPGGSQYGIGLEEVGAIFPVFGLAAQATPYGAEAQESGERILYTLARSINPGIPVFNTAHSPARNRALHEGNLFEFIHARVWEGAMEGLSAIALTAPDPRSPGRPSYLNQPEALEGFATANLDINRLLDIVLAFQRAPAELAILWSDSSSIYEDGEAFLPSAANAYTGVSTSGLKVRFITESQCKNGELDGVDLLIIPNTPAFDDKAMAAVETYVDQGKPIIRAAKPMPYNERGGSRLDVVRFGNNTLLVRGTGRVSEYLHAMDAALYKGYIASKPRAINEYGYPQEGVRTRYIEFDGARYLYIINLRTTPIFTHLFGPYSSGTDLIRGESISFPGTLQPLRPMLLRLDTPDRETEGAEGTLEISTPEINAGEGTSQGTFQGTRRVEVKPLDSDLDS